MRMRKKPNLQPRLARCAPVIVDAPEAHRGRWLADCPGHRELHLEIGCGKGRFTVETAKAAPDILLVAVEKVPDAMVIATERAMAEAVSNVRFMDLDALRLGEVFAPGEAARIYLNFSDPWPARRHAARRLTHGGFLAIYRELLSPGGEIWLKTDNAPLFDFSLAEFQKAGFLLSEVTRNLHEHGCQGIMTDYEGGFHAQGVPIHRCVARR